MYAMLFMAIFGVALLLAAASLVLSKDPRMSPLLYKVMNLTSMPLEDAKKLARHIAKIVAIIGLVMIVVFGIGYLILYFTME